MNHVKALTRSAISAAVLATIAAAASAGSITVTARNVAQEAFGSAVTSATTVITPDIGYVFSTPGGIVINPGGSIHVTLTPTNGLFATVGSVGVPAGIGGSVAATATVNTNTGAVDVLLTNASGTSNTNATIGVGATLTLAAGTASGVTGLASGTPMSVVGKAGVSAGGSELEATSASANLLTSSKAVAIAAAAGGETAKINLNTTPTAGVSLTGGIVAGNQIEQVGTVTFTNNSVAALDLAATTAVMFNSGSNATNGFGAQTYTLTLASGAFTAGTAYTLKTGTCTGTDLTPAQSPVASSVTGATATITLTLAAASNAPVASTTPVVVCATFPSTAAISPYQPNIAVAVAPSSATAYTGSSLAATALYNLTNNASQVDVLNYIPAAVTGYLQTIRLINAGSVAATPTVALINEATGVVGNAVSIGTSIPAGGSLRLNQAAIEALVGALPSNVRPRLRFVANTPSLKVQSLFNNANGAYTNLSGIEQ